MSHTHLLFLVFACVASLTLTIPSTRGADNQPKKNVTTLKIGNEDIQLSFIWPLIKRLTNNETNTERVRELSNSGIYSYNYLEKVQDIANRWTKGTIFDGRVRINRPYRHGHVNIYILDEESIKIDNFKCGCSYLPGATTIVCDGNFLQSATKFLSGPLQQELVRFQKKLDSDDEEQQVAVKILRSIVPIYDTFMREWLIAHEIGHLVLDHSKDDLSRTWDYKDGQGIGLSIEREADEFYISRLQHTNQVLTWQAISQLVTRLYHSGVLASHRAEELGDFKALSVNRDVKVPYNPNRHPPFLIRALELADAVRELYPTVVDSSGYFERIRERVKLDRGQTRRTIPCKVAPPPDTAADPVALLAQLWTQVYAGESDHHLDQTLSAFIEALRQYPENDFDQVSHIATLIVRAAKGEDIAEQLEAVSVRVPDDGSPQSASKNLLIYELNSYLNTWPTETVAEEKISRTVEFLETFAESGWRDYRPGSPHRFEGLSTLARIASGLPNIDKDVKSHIVLEAVTSGNSSTQDAYTYAEFLNFRLKSPRNIDNLLLYGPAIAEFAWSHGWSVKGTMQLKAVIELMKSTDGLPPETIIRAQYSAARRWAHLLVFEEALSTVTDALQRLSSATGATNAANHYQTALFSNQAGFYALHLSQFELAQKYLSAAHDLLFTHFVSENSDCTPTHEPDGLRATVLQNLSDLLLARGRYRDAIATTTAARKCREIRGAPDIKLSESWRTAGIAHYMLGNMDISKPLLQDFLRLHINAFDTVMVDRIYENYYGGAWTPDGFVAIRSILSDFDPTTTRLGGDIVE